jgi:hypothetical protein
VTDEVTIEKLAQLMGWFQPHYLKRRHEGQDSKFDHPKRRRQGGFADEDYNDRNRCGKNVFGVDGHYFIRAYEIVSPPAPEIVR